MTTTAIFLAILLGGGVVFVSLLPFFAQDEDEPALTRSGLRGTERQNRAMEVLWAEKLRLLRSLRDLDFDYDMNKLSADMYEFQRVQLVRQAVLIMKRIDRLEDAIAAQHARVDEAIAEFRQHVQRSRA